MQCAHITRDMQPLQQTLQEHHQPLRAPQTHRAGSSPVFSPPWCSLQQLRSLSLARKLLGSLQG